ncbi:MAG: polysaccharide biosynthesis/export family protein [Deltaproteobacteria bacterium]|nr:polysaccharide biosynthesis/export family protein [Deltaproteobacteria bacterium]
MRSGASPADYPLGPGDVLEISAPPVAEIQNYAVRISGDGTLVLPLIGVVPTTGLSEGALTKEIQRRLEVTFVRNPQVHVFVREYRSRQVAVLGAVSRPGMYSLTSGSETLLDALALAGGASERSASFIYLIPAEDAGMTRPQQFASTASVLSGESSSSFLVKRNDPLVIDLRSSNSEMDLISRALPVKPGDVVIVPDIGEVLVEGWVERPGSYKISPESTVTRAITAAGGLSFAADATMVKILRSDKTGAQSIIMIDVEKIKQGEAQDIPVQAGDFIEVPYSQAKVVPYGMYNLLASMIRIGFGVNIRSDY